MRDPSQKAPDVEASNGRLTLRLAWSKGRASQQVLEAGSGRLLLDALAGDVGLNLAGRSTWLPYDRVRMVDAGKDRARLRATISRPELEITTVFDLRQDGSLDVSTALSARTHVPLCSLEHRYVFAPAQASPHGDPWDDVWLPHRKAGVQEVVGQQAFRSPCLLVQKGDAHVSMLPALDQISPDSPLPVFMDLHGPELRCGLASYHIAGERFERDDARVVTLTPGQSVRFGFTLLAGVDLEPGSAHSRAVRALWQRYGARRSGAIAPQTLFFDDFCRYAFDAILLGPGAWRQFDLNGSPVGGTLSRAGDPAAGAQVAWLLPESVRPVRSAVPVPRLAGGTGETRSVVSFSARGNALRTAFGMLHFGHKWGDERLKDAGERVVRLWLTAACPGGLVPLAFVGTPRRPAWLAGRFRSLGQGYYGTADMAETGVWMLTHAREFPADGLGARARALADAFLASQSAEGDVPAFLVPDGQGARGVGGVPAGASTAAAGRFLAALAAEGDERCASAAARAADWLLRAGLQRTEWAEPGRLQVAHPERGPGRSVQDALPMLWGAELLARVYRLTGEQRYLHAGRSLLDRALLFQQVWKPPFFSVDTFGGFGASNLDLCWNAPGGVLFVPILLDYWDLLGEAEYAARAMAALRAAFVLMRVPANRDVAPGAKTGTADVPGLIPAGYGAAGEDRPLGVASPDWGSGSAAAMVAWVQRAYGDVYVDAEQGRALVTNAARLVDVRVSGRAMDLHLERLPAYAELEHRTPLSRLIAQTLVVKCHGVPSAQTSLWVNGDDLGAHLPTEYAAGIPWPPGNPQ